LVMPAYLNAWSHVLICILADNIPASL